MRRYGHSVCLIAALCLAACDSANVQAAEAAARAEQLLNAGQTDAAIRELIKSTSLRDDNAATWTLLGRAWSEANEPGRALSAFVRARELDPANVGLLLAVGEISLLAGRIDDAERSAEAALALDPGNVRAKLVLGFVAFNRNRFADALKAADSILEANQGETGAVILKARTLIATGNPKAATALVEPIAASQPLPGLVELLRDAATASNDAAAAEAAAGRLAALAPENLGFQIDYIDRLYRARKADQATAALVALSQRRSRDPRIERTIVDVWRKAGSTTAAAGEAARVGRTAPPVFRRALIRFAVEQRNAPLALSLLNDVDPDPGNAALAGLRARALAQLGRLDEAVRLSDQLLAADASHSDALVARADVASRRRQFGPALAAARRATAESTDEPEAWLLLASILDTQGDPLMAEKALATGASANPASVSLATAHIAFLRRASRLDDARSAASAFLRRNPESIDGKALLRAACGANTDGACNPEVSVPTLSKRTGVGR